MSDPRATETSSDTNPPAPSNGAGTCHPDVTCPVCSDRGKTVRMLPVKAHYQCPECRYHDSCCM
jgi:hypothetical protein